MSFLGKFFLHPHTYLGRIIKCLEVSLFNELQIKFKEVDNLRFLLLALLFIVLLGNVMVFSSSYIFARENYGTPFYFFFRQIIYTIFGATLMIVVSKTKYTFWIKYSKHFLLVSTALVGLTFVPGIGVEVKGANRWLNLLVVSFQPGELLKYGVLFYSIYFFEVMSRGPKVEQLRSIPFLFVPLSLLVMQPDFGTFFICSAVILFVAYLSNFNRKYLYALVVTGFFSVVGVLLMAPYRVARLVTFLDPWKNPKSSGFQIIQSFLAFSNGGITGVGLGNSDEKLFYLPEAHNDFIFSVLGEELGLLGVVFFITILMVFIYNGLKLSISPRNNLVQTLIIAGVIFLIGFQAFLNMGVVMGVLPTKGLNLPFVSFGGSSIICNFFGVGVLLSVINKKHATH